MQELLTLLETKYMAKILGFSYQKLQNYTEAEDMASDITLEVMKVIHSGKEIENFNALVWSISNHVFCKRLRKKKHGDTAYLTELFRTPDNVEAETLKKEQENLLRREISMLAEKYRRAVVLHYFDGKSCEEIGEILGQSAGTVKWWLHEARTSIKEGMDTMREYGEKSFNPGALYVSCQGSLGKDDEPVSCAKRRLTQNILLAAYEEPVTVKELCVEHGVSAAYIEDEVQALVDNQLLKEVSRGKFQTDFVILPNDNSKVLHKIYEVCFPTYSDKLMAFLEEHKELLSKDKFNLPGFSWERLLWVYIPMVTDFALNLFRSEHCNMIGGENMPQRPKGGQWIALGYRGGMPEFGKRGADWKEYLDFDGPVHKPDEMVQGFFHHWSGTDSTPFFDIFNAMFRFYGLVLSGQVPAGYMEAAQKVILSEGVQHKLFSKEGDGFQANYYYVEESELEQLFQLAMEFYKEAEPVFTQAWKIITEEFEKTVPKHLHWQMENFLSNYLNGFVTCTLYDAMNQGLLSDPDVEGREWLSLFSVIKKDICIG